MAIFKIEGNNMPSPSNILHSYRSIGKSEENAAGNRVYDRLALKHDITVEWAHLTAAEANTLTSAVSSETFMDVYFYDPKTSTYITEEMSAEIKKIKDGMYASGEPEGYLQIQIAFEQR